MYNRFIIYGLSLLAFWQLSSCSDDTAPAELQPNGATPNILLIIADDLGKDAIAGYSEGSLKANTPNLNNLRNNGVAFTNFWTYPTCSPTRASILTGKYGYRTGVLGAGDELNTNELSLQEYIAQQTGNVYATAIVGKWHLSGNNPAANPEQDFGIDYYSGLIRGSVDDYYRWQLTEDGQSSLQTGYATEVITNMAASWIEQQEKPWFMWLAYNAPHTPYHIPPQNMHSQGSLPAYSASADALPYYLAAVEAMDYQIGLLLAGIPEAELEHTVIIFIGDNGTPNKAAQNPYSSLKVKNTLYQGGINVPMVISGKGVLATGTNANLINSTDLFATIGQLAGANATTVNDSKSFLPVLENTVFEARAFQYSEMNDGLANIWTISNGAYKLIQVEGGADELYELLNDPYENNNLLETSLTTEAQAAKLDLENELTKIRN